MATQSLPLCCSSEANDLALQIAEAATGHTEVIAIDGAYHGHTKPLMGLSSYKLQQQKDGANGIHPNPHAWVAPTPDPYRGKYRNPDTAGQQYADEVKKIIDSATEKGKKVWSCDLQETVICPMALVM